MKILITGKNSYIGGRFRQYLKKFNNQYEVTETSVESEGWKTEDWSNYDSVIHVAGIAHNSSDPKLKDLYYSVNCDLALDVAKKSKRDGVSQFVYLSSMIVFGSNIPNGRITKETLPNPDNFYGDSKLQAEIRLEKIKTEDFKIAIVRPPIVYGKGSKGNYPKLAKLAKLIPVFPNYPNKRSMIYIENLTEFLRLIVTRQKEGYFHPQNSEYVSTSQMVKLIGSVHKNRVRLISFLNPLITACQSISIVKKVFGNQYYDMNLSEIGMEYQINNFEESICKTEL